MNAFVSHLTKKVPVVRSLVEERNVALIERDTALAERAAALTERDTALAAREAAIAELDKVLIAQEAANAVKPAASGVNADDVTACIEMILGRTPDAELVDYHLRRGFPDRFALGKYMISTGEFQSRYAQATRNVRPASVFLGDRVLTLTHRGNIIYLDPRDNDLTPWIALYGEWERHVENTIVATLRPGDTVIDIGANVGYHTLAMANAVGPGGQIHAFEANPQAMRLLRATMSLNGFGWVRLYDKAALDQLGTFTLASDPDHFGSGHVITERQSSDYGAVYSTRVEVAAVTLDAELADQVGIVDLIHMDIEGSEPLALPGAQALIEQSPNIKIITEWSVQMMSTRADVGDYVAWLVKLGFGFWLIEPGAGLTKIDPSVAPTLPHCDLFLSRGSPP